MQKTFANSSVQERLAVLARLRGARKRERSMMEDVQRDKLRAQNALERLRGTGADSGRYAPGMIVAFVAREMLAVTRSKRAPVALTLAPALQRAAS